MIWSIGFSIMIFSLVFWNKGEERNHILTNQLRISFAYWQNIEVLFRNFGINICSHMTWNPSLCLNVWLHVSKNGPSNDMFIKQIIYIRRYAAEINAICYVSRHKIAWQKVYIFKQTTLCHHISHFNTRIHTRARSGNLIAPIFCYP